MLDAELAVQTGWSLQRCQEIRESCEALWGTGESTPPNYDAPARPVSKANTFLTFGQGMCRTRLARAASASVVFVPGLEESRVPGNSRSKHPLLLKESAHRLRLAITRARQACILSYAKSSDAFGSGRAPCRFLQRIASSFEDRSSALSTEEIRAVLMAVADPARQAWIETVCSLGRGTGGVDVGAFRPGANLLGHRAIAFPGEPIPPLDGGGRRPSFCECRRALDVRDTHVVPRPP